MRLRREVELRRRPSPAFVACMWIGFAVGAYALELLHVIGELP